MASPLSIFRKYQAALLVGFGIVLMFAFVIAPTLDDYLRSMSGGGSGGDPTVVEWKYGALSETDLGQMRSLHLLTVRFLRTLVSQVEVIEPVPVKIDGKDARLIDKQLYPLAGQGKNAVGEDIFQVVVNGEIVEIPQTSARRLNPKVSMIPEARSEQELVRKMLLAKKAEQMGVVVSVDAILDYLGNLCDASVKPDYARLLLEATRGKLNEQQLMAQLHQELLAQRMLMMSQSGISSAPPKVLFECYNRLNRRVTAELLPVEVADFASKVPKPTAQEIQEMYDAGKDRFPLSSSPDPGFKHRQKIAFGYFQGVFDDFLNRELEQIRPKITTEQIEKYYEDNKTSEFKIPDLPPAQDTPEQSDTDAKSDDAMQTPGTEPGDQKDSPAANDVTPEADKPAAEKPEAEEPAAEKPAAEKPAAEKPAAEKPAAEKPAAEKPAAEQDEPAASQPPAADPTTPDDTSMIRQQGDLLVSFVAQDTAEAADDDPPATPSPADAPVSEPGKSDPASSKDDAAKAEAEAGVETGAEADSKDESPSSEAGEMAEPAADAEGQPPAAAEPEPKYKPLDDELREEIRDNLARRQARPIAEEKLEEGISQARDKVRDYARELLLSQQLDEEPEPDAIDWDAVAKEHGLVYNETPLLDLMEMFELQRADPETAPAYSDFARATETRFDPQAGMARRTILDVGFGGNVELFTPRRLLDGFVSQSGFSVPPQAMFLYWRLEEVPESVPELKDIEDVVIAECRQKSALPLAESKAKEMAESAQKQAGKSLKELFPEHAARVISTSEFSWMTQGAVAMGGGGMPQLSPVSGAVDGQPADVPGAGSEFMRSVFDLNVDQVGSAVNQPETVVFVVRVVNESLSSEERRELFFSGGVNRDVATILQIEQTEIVRAWFRDLEDDFQVSWKRDASQEWDLQ